MVVVVVVVVMMMMMMVVVVLVMMMMMMVVVVVVMVLVVLSPSPSPIPSTTIANTKTNSDHVAQVLRHVGIVDVANGKARVEVQHSVSAYAHSSADAAYKGGAQPHCRSVQWRRRPAAALTQR
eukprot:2402306-Rhodomonas_salina.1